jgi:mono/diheme cytochrome c family protein
MSAFRLRGAATIALAATLAMISAPAIPQSVDDSAPPPLGQANGEQVYRQICQGCHMPDGGGAVGAGSYPAFRGNPNLASSRYLAVIVLDGRRNMPAFRRPEQQDFFFPPTWLSDQQVADVVNYLRSEFGGIADEPITAADVAALKTP